jgi:hypothetical protein
MAVDHYKKVDAAWGAFRGAAFKPVDPDRAVKIALSVYAYMFGKPFKGETRITSGNRHTWVNRGVLVVNPAYQHWHASGTVAIVHTLSHYGHSRINAKHNNHGRIHAEFEAEIAAYVVRKFFSEGSE